MSDIPEGFVDLEEEEAEAAFQEQQQRQQGSNGTAEEDEDEDPRRFRPVRFKDVPLDISRPYLVKRILPRGGLIVIWGPPKCGKTFWTLDLALHVALGRTYRGRRVHQGTVVYIASEGERGLSARIAAFKKTKLNGDGDPPFYLLRSRLNLVRDVDQLIRDIRATLDNEECVLMVIDTLNRTISGSESNDVDMTLYIDAADKLRQAFNAAIAIIHHCGTNEKRPRGHTSLAGADDAQIKAEKDAAGIVDTAVEHMKDDEEGATTRSRLVRVEVGTDEDGEPITSTIVEPVEDGDKPAAKSTGGKAKPKLIPRDQIALDALRNAISDAGQPAPASNHVPAGATVVSNDLWRRYYLSTTKGEDDRSEDARRRKLLRARESLASKSIIGTWEEMVWVV